MRYVIVDQDGSSREYFDFYEDVLAAIDELRAEDLVYASELMIVAYGAAGERVGDPVLVSALPYRSREDAVNVTLSSSDAGRSLEVECV